MLPPRDSAPRQRPKTTRGDTNIPPQVQVLLPGTTKLQQGVGKHMIANRLWIQRIASKNLLSLVPAQKSKNCHSSLQPYAPATSSAPASHRNLLRMYYQVSFWNYYQVSFWNYYQVSFWNYYEVSFWNYYQVSFFEIITKWAFEIITKWVFWNCYQVSFWNYYLVFEIIARMVSTNFHSIARVIPSLCF